MSVVTEDDFITAFNSEAEYSNHDDTVIIDAYQSPELTAASILNLFDTDSGQRLSFVKQIIEDIDEGRRDARAVHLNLKNMEDIISRLTNVKENPDTATKYRKLLMDECALWGKSFEYHNAKFSLRGTGGKADYSQCGDPTIIELEAEFEAIKAKLDERKNYLDNLPSKGIEMVDFETASVFTIYPPAKPKNETVVVKLS